MKAKYFLRGLGAGILLATIVLFAVYSYRYSDSKIIQRAKELGMVYDLSLIHISEPTRP